MKMRPVTCTAIAVLALAALAAPVPFTVGEAVAAQPWYCVCRGVKKRYLASTRFCEHKMKLPKGKWCTAAQYRAVYGPACRRQGCSLPPG